MDLEPDGSDYIEPKPSQIPESSAKLRTRAEVAVIVRKYGDLEAIRGRLGLSRRKICQLLLVDPSAWSRWSQSSSGAPPHIYRALEWYLLLTDKEPRALLPIGSWSTTAFEDRFQTLESGIREFKTAQLPVSLIGRSQNWIWYLLVGLLLGLLIGTYDWASLIHSR